MFPRGAGSLKQGHKCTKSRGKKQQLGSGAGRLEDKMVIRKASGISVVNCMINKHEGERERERTEERG